MVTGSSITDQIKERLNIVDIIGKYVQLKKSGKNHFGLCPFHGEKTPSFSVNEDLGYFKCFGCGESGDVITFVEKIEGLDFKEALELLGKEAGIKVDFSKIDSPEEKARQRLFELNALAQKFYQYILLKHQIGRPGREYLKKRKLTAESINEFGIGYAPSSSRNKDIFINYAKKRGWSQKELLDAGFAVEREGQFIDKFRERVMFAIYDIKGRVVAFSGRIIKPSDYAPKYLNSPDTPVFHKSEILYGLYQGRNEVRATDMIILVEGQTDVISSHQSGVQNIVAPLGTGLTEGHLKLVKRYTENVAFCFDQDIAGEKAIIRGVQMAQNLDMEVSAIPISGAKDVDELIQTNSKKWKESATKPVKIIDYLLDRLLKRIDINTVDGKVELMSEISPFVIAVQNPIKKEHYINEISRQVGIDKEIILSNLARVAREQTYEIKREIRTQIASKSTLGQEQYVIGRILQYPEVAMKIRSKFSLDMFSSEEFKTIVEELEKAESVTQFSKYLGELDTELRERLANMTLQNVEMEETLTQVEDDFIKVVEILRERSLRNRITGFKRSLSEENSEETMEELKAMTDELAEIQKNKRVKFTK